MLFAASARATTPHLNLFNPYDRVVLPPERPCVAWQVWGGFEGVVHARSFQADENEFGIARSFCKRVGVLQLYQDEQDLLAALKGDDFLVVRSQLAQQFNIDDDNGTLGLFIPHGDFGVQNFWLSARYYLPHGFSLSVHLPIMKMQLKNVWWEPSPRAVDTAFDGSITDDFIAMIERAGNINLYDWSRAGVGDLTGLVWWAHNYPQMRPFLQNVYLSSRLGLVAPTGKKTDENVMLGLPFGNDAGMGVLFGATMELSLCNYWLFGIDAEFLSLFGDTRVRRIKTDPAQTDLAFLSKACVFLDPGFIQHFTLYGRADHFVGGVSLGVAYQYTKQQDSKLYLGTYHFDPAVANSAEEWLSWTNHSVIFTASFDAFTGDNDPHNKPWLEVFFKHGFNGSRTVAADTVGFVLAVDF